MPIGERWRAAKTWMVVAFDFLKNTAKSALSGRQATIVCVTTSLFDLYKIGVGPSSSHTMGPMRAAARFARGLGEHGTMEQVARVQIDLYGSLALTGLGHGTDRAVLLGLSGKEPATIDPGEIGPTVASIREAQ